MVPVRLFGSRRIRPPGQPAIRYIVEEDGLAGDGAVEQLSSLLTATRRSISSARSLNRVGVMSSSSPVEV